MYFFYIQELLSDLILVTQKKVFYYGSPLNI